MNILSFIPLGSFFTILFVWFYIWAAPSNTPAKRALLFFAALDIPFLGFELLMFVPLLYPYVHLFFWLMAPFWLLMGFGFLNFIYRWTRRRNDVFYYAILALSFVATLYFLFSGKVHLGYEVTEHAVLDFRDPLLHALVATPSILGGSMGIFLLWRTRQQESNASNKRIHGIMLLGAVMTLSAIVMSDVVLPDFFDSQHFMRLGSSMFVFFILLVYLAIRKYHFLQFSIDEVAVPFFEKMNDAVFWIEDGTRIRRMNAAARDWFQVTGDYEGTSITTFLPRIDKQRISVKVRSQERQLKISFYPIYKNSLEMLRVIVLKDETEIQKARSILRSRRDELEKEAFVRSERLRQAQRLEALATLSGGIAHEFNNLLTTIMGYASAALDDIQEADPIKEDLAEVLNAAERARDIVKQMLSLSDTDNQELQVLDMADLTREALKLINVSIPAGITVAFELEPNLYTRGNHTRLHQAILNLLTNGIHAMDKRFGELKIQLSQKDLLTPHSCANGQLPCGRYVSLIVEDTGCGISMEQLPRIFEPFYTTRKAGEGTGIGLATVFKVVEEHQGGIIVRSAVGVGTIFEMLLPVAGRSAEPTVPDMSAQSQYPSGGTIWVIDDNELILKVTRRILEPLGVTVQTFAHPESAIDEFRKTTSVVHLALVDFGLPTMNGLELAKVFRSITPRLPIVLFSGKMTSSLEREAETLGLQGCLPKPIGKSQLVKAVQKFLPVHKDRGIV